MEIIKPFIKWAGGKGSLLPQLNKYYPNELDCDIDTYVEPFVGGGAVLIDILQKYNIKNAYAFDINQDLINCYNIVKNNVNELIKELEKKEEEYKVLNEDDRKKYYYAVREKYNSNSLVLNKLDIIRASEFIFLNRTCFNGLYRVNKDGKFNVPGGKYKNPTICNRENLLKLSKLFTNVIFTFGDYKKSEEYINEKTFVYFDPPYRPLSITSGFTSYTKEDFNDDDQKELAMYFEKLNDKNAKLMLSNSNPKNINKEDNFFEEIYKGFNINEISANRMINANANGRGKITELLITNYEENEECIQENFTMKIANLN